jgi:hypothetical protein
MATVTDRGCWGTFRVIKKCCSEWSKSVVPSGPKVLFRAVQKCCSEWSKSVVPSGQKVLFRVVQKCCSEWLKSVVPNGPKVLFLRTPEHGIVQVVLNEALND